jgi:hypothetical protein
MATSGTTIWNLNVAEIIETAARRSRGADVGSLSAKDAKEARTCLNMVLTDLTNAGHPLSALEFKTLNLTQGTASYTLPEDVLDIFDIVYARYNGAGSNPLYTETPLTRIDLAAYNQINNKTMQSYLSEYALDRRTNSVNMYLYPVPENSDDKLNYWALTRLQDISAMNQDVDLSYRYSNTLVAGVSYYMGMETPTISEEKLARLKVNYQEALDLAFGEDRDRTSFYITPSVGKRY